MQKIRRFFYKNLLEKRGNGDAVKEKGSSSITNSVVAGHPREKRLEDITEACQRAYRTPPAKENSRGWMDARCQIK